MDKQRLVPDYIFESSWEVCNKVGGIYTVLSTRADTLQKKLRDCIIFIGPDCWKGSICPYFEGGYLRSGIESKGRKMAGSREAYRIVS